MKSARILLGLAAALALASPSIAQTDVQKAFAAIKKMPGTWEQKRPDGKTLDVTFRVVSNGSAVISEISVPGEDMISMIHLDGPNRILLTHYCGTGNQPRMLGTVSPDGKTITFSYMDATNLAGPDAARMNKVVFTLLDENHHTEEWTFVDHGNEMKELFDLRRKL